MTLLICGEAPSATPAMIDPGSSAGMAFARYLASMQERDVFTESGPVAVEIEASLPSLYKESRLVAIREIGDSERSEYRVLEIEGDPIVAQEVIATYLLVERKLEEFPSSTLAVTPENYKFRYKGEVGKGNALAYVYEVSPRKKRDGLIQGKLWIDSASGIPILETGRLVKSPTPFCGKIEIVRDTELKEGSPRTRVTHVNIETPHAGHGELTIVEVPLTAITDEPEPQPQASPLARN